MTPPPPLIKRSLQMKNLNISKNNSTKITLRSAFAVVDTNPQNGYGTG